MSKLSCCLFSQKVKRLYISMIQKKTSDKIKDTKHYRKLSGEQNPLPYHISMEGGISNSVIHCHYHHHCHNWSVCICWLLSCCWLLLSLPLCTPTDAAHHYHYFLLMLVLLMIDFLSSPQFSVLLLLVLICC